MDGWMELIIILNQQKLCFVLSVQPWPNPMRNGQRRWRTTSVLRSMNKSEQCMKQLKLVNSFYWFNHNHNNRWLGGSPPSLLMQALPRCCWYCRPPPLMDSFLYSKWACLSVFTQLVEQAVTLDWLKLFIIPLSCQDLRGTQMQLWISVWMRQVLEYSRSQADLKGTMKMQVLFSICHY